ncbi:GNAT family N-acetyltransferase [Rossellomorea vietnamensis]|uniref:GNAT family N-acetyltransferase n=1 Tax=Rossellomorea aquimaris TaxID=189382 RepID=A0A5D4U7I5_9BACI|nr:GNAT family N-acetyltransferase [Rossellomorea aquimaris]TYS83222.1 GNAT family N-acetyltransferase [Rossellomorea aquimaris]
MNWKLLEGEGYSTFEWNGKAKIISDKEFEHLEFLLNLIEKKRVTVAVPAGFGRSEKLKYLGFNKVKEREVYFRNLEDISGEASDSILTIIEEPEAESTLSCLTDILDDRQEAENIIESLTSEVAPDKYKIILVRVGGKAAGLYIPHIEPHTEDEGRLFFFGIMPYFRGCGYAAEIHKTALASLKSLNAKVYAGVTDSDNLPMKKVFERNGCTKSSSLEIYKR